MSPSRYPLRALALIGFVLLASGCKLVIDVPEGATVTSESGAYSCPSQQSCSIDLVDVFFDETFAVEVEPGYTFLGWSSAAGALCAEALEPCNVTTTLLADFPELMSLLDSDASLLLSPTIIKNPVLTEANLEVSGETEPLEDGFRVLGSVALQGAGSARRTFDEADLSVTFSEEGELLSMVGESALPPALTDNVGIVAAPRASLGLVSGAEINADPEIDITLLDQRKYMLFFLGGAVDLELGDRKGGSNVATIGTPLGGKVIMILDPFDEMLYYYGDVLGDAVGNATSDSGLLPYRPQIGHAAIDEFNGHTYTSGSKSIGVKALDVLSFTGEFIVREPSFADINLEDPFASETGYIAGFNGSAEVAFSVVGFDLFSFDLASASAGFTVTTEKQSLGIYSVLAPDVSWQPDWFPILPEAELAASFSVTGEGTLNALISGSYESVIPPADLEGDIAINNSGVRMSALIKGDSFDLPVAMTFADGETIATVGISLGLSDAVSSQVDVALATVERSILVAEQELLDATEGLEFEVSLRGFRQAIPSISSTVIGILDAIPGQVRSSVYSQVYNEVESRACGFIWGCSTSPSFHAGVAADAARSRAIAEIAPYKSMLQNLASRAAEADDASARAALRSALNQAYSLRRINKRITVSTTVLGQTFSKSYTIDRDILTPSQVNQVLQAIDSVDAIPAAEGRVINAQSVIARLPTQAVVAAVRQEVQKGTAVVPDVIGVSYRIANDEYIASIDFSDGSSFEVEFNVLDPRELVGGISQLLASMLIND